MSVVSPVESAGPAPVHSGAGTGGGGAWVTKMGKFMGGRNMESFCVRGFFCYQKCRETQGMRVRGVQEQQDGHIHWF